MAAADAAAAQPLNDAPTPVWDEDQYTAALAHLERLKTQLDDLRLAIPRVVQPLYSPPTPSMFRAFRDNLTTSQTEIKNFRKDWQENETQGILEHAAKRLEADDDLSASVEVERFGWVRRAERLGKKKEKSVKAEGESNRVEILEKEDVSQVVDEWKGQHEKIKLERSNGNRDLWITFTASSLRQRFHVVIAEEENGYHKLDAECWGKKERDLAVTRCIKTRPRPNNLKHLLGMIAAYKTVEGSLCAKCGEMFDSQLLGTVARRSREAVVEEGKTEELWEAFHEGCMP